MNSKIFYSKALILLIILSYSVSCSSDDPADIVDEETNEITNSQYKLKSRKANNGGEFYSSYFQYDSEGKVVSAIGYTSPLNGIFEYDSKNRLIKVSNEFRTVTFQYDEANRLIKEEIDRVDDFWISDIIDFEYQGNTVIRTRSTVTQFQSEVRLYKLFVDNSGRIIGAEYMNQTSNQSEEGIITETYEYDSRGNIIKMIRQLPYETDARISNLTYDNHPNPFYDSMKSAYKYANYALSIHSGGVRTYLNWGICPNNINNQFSFEYNSDGLPIVWYAVNTVWYLEYH